MDRRLATCLVTLAVATAAGAQGAAPPPRVAALELRLPAGEDPEAARLLVAITAGDPLLPSALRRTVQRLYQTGRFRNVIVRAAPVAAPAGAAGEWVRVVVEGLAVRVLGTLDVRVDGAAPAGLDAAALRSAARLVVGEPFDDDVLQDATRRVRALLARRGFRAAEVIGRGAGERTVAAEIVVRPGEPVRVRALTLGGDGGAPGALSEVPRTRAGAVLDEDALSADVRALRTALHRAGYRRSRVSAPVVRVEGALADVEIPVEAGPRLAFAFRGNEDVPSEVLVRQLGFEEEQPVDPPSIAGAVDRLVTFYRARGYATARIEAAEVRRGAMLAVTFHVDEGLRYRLAPVRIEGGAYRSEAWLREALVALLDDGAPEPESADADRARALLVAVPTVRSAPTAPAALLPHEVWDETTWERAAERLVDAYRAEGFLEAISLGSSVVLDRSTRTAQATLRLREGVRTHVEAISFEGNQAVSLPDLAREARLAPGGPLVFDEVEATRAALLRIYRSRGYVYARVNAREELDRERHVAALRFVIDEGPRVRIGRILVTGNRRTREEVVRRALAVSEGAVYDPEAVARSQAALLRLGVFRSVGLRLHDADVPEETKDVAVEVAERPWAMLSQGVGFSIANGPRAVLEYTQPNLLGRALELSGRGKINYPLDQFRPDLVGKTPAERLEGRADVGVRSSALQLPLPTAARADVIGEILHRRAYDLRRATVVTGLDVGVTSRIAVSLQYELEVDRIAKTESVGLLTQADLERLRFDQGVTTLHALRPSVSLDYRDNSAHPHRGWFATGALELERSLGTAEERLLLGILPGSDIHTNMIKLSATASGYLPVARSSVLALSVRGGRVFPLDGRSRTIVPRRFFLGGATTMRGYAEEEMVPQDVRTVLAGEAHACETTFTGVGCTGRGKRITDGERPVSEGGEAFLLGKAELRLRVRGSVEAGLFADLGNVWLDPRKYRLLDLRANVGFGIRFVTPIGPAALDFGFNVMPDDGINERLFAPHFTIGLF
jgi:outer membrane protein assembly complex protein YaeT